MMGAKLPERERKKRDARLVAMYRDGYRVKAIATRFGLSVEQVRAIASAAGVRRETRSARRLETTPPPNARRSRAQRAIERTLWSEADPRRGGISVFRAGRRQIALSVMGKAGQTIKNPATVVGYAIRSALRRPAQPDIEIRDGQGHLVRVLDGESRVEK